MTQTEFQLVIPERPLCADVGFEIGSHRLPRELAIQKPIIQPNSRQYIRFLVFDIDEPNAAHIVEMSGLPQPTFFVENESSGRGHAIYALAVPVSLSPSTRMAPLKLLAAIQRGFTRRLRADRAYGGLLCKTPFHPKWRTVAPPQPAFDAAKLVECLEKDDKKFWDRADKEEPPVGLGRNCLMFWKVRKIAYRAVLRFKKRGETQTDLRKFLELSCQEINHTFETLLPTSEVRSIAKSISKWVWQRFTPEGLSIIQSQRGRRRWRKTPITMESLKPWESDGISRAQWYRRKAERARLSDMAKVSSSPTP